MLQNTVTVFGGTGFVGRAVVNQLSKAGYNTKVVVRRPERFREFALYPQTKLAQLNSYEDAAALATILQGSDIVIDLIADRTTATEMVEKDDFDVVSQKMKSALETAGVKRVLSLSQIGANNHVDSHTWQGSLAALDNHMNTTAKAAVTLFKAGLLIGEGDDTTTPFAKQLNRMPVLMVANSATQVQPLWVRDFAQAMVQSIHATATFGKTLEVAGTQVMTLKALGKMVAEIMQVQDAVVFPMCKFNAKIMAALGGLAPFQSVTKSQLVTLGHDAVTDASFAEQFGFEPASIEWLISTYAAPKHLRERYNDYRKYANRN
ncbi:complex I NDUFA9 subunit family protein [Thiosulfatimonas sediminis]|uniref:Complex I NDUFA9 subunit family protein n=1 Tax=Thiosulfatimonas sediminis TaxID=2675054 RepID=A0A6F8PS23_9GAMM|nr:NAD(P)H-binding protein [Thiosulfatimonas sediminis]BBP44909.1 complex I NDUFA9 subunit family protein [Thiosulfatimonas sediminis]